MDNLITIALLIFLIFTLLTTIIVLVMKVQSESVQLITILSNILNENLYSKPELRAWLPEKQKLNKIYLSSINNFYLYGREWLSKSLKSSAFFESSQNLNNKSEYLILEAQILNQWDSLYAYLTKRASKGINATASNIFNKTKNSFENVVLLPPSNPIVVTNVSTNATVLNNTIAALAKNTSIFETISFSKKSLKDIFKYKQMAVIIKDNMGIFMSVVDSLYTIIKGNVNLLTTIIYTVISTIFSSGFALMNFIFSV
jgi:hypothetical protein